MDFSGIAFAIALAVSFVVLLPLLFGGVFVIVVVANRADPDVSGRRPAVVYGFATAFLTLFVTLFGTVAVVAALSNLIGPHRGAGGGGEVGFTSYSPLSAQSFGRTLHP